MRILKERNRLSRSHYRKQPDQNGPYQTTRCCRLDYSTNPYRHQKIPRIHRLLQVLCTKLFKNCTTTPRSYEESHTMALGTQAQMCFRRTENANVCGTGISTTKFRKEILFTSRCIGFRHGLRTLAGGRTFHPLTPKTTKTHTSPCGILFSNIHTYRTKLRYLQTGITSCDEKPPTLAPLPRMDEGTIYDLNRSCKSYVLEVPTKPEQTNCTLARRSPGI